MATEVLLKVDLGLWMVTSPNEGETQRDKKKKIQGWEDSVAGTPESLRPPEMGSVSSWCLPAELPSPCYPEL